MFQHMFASMNDVLCRIMSRYSDAPPEEREEMLEQLAMFRKMNDAFIEEWLQMEEKLTDLSDAFPEISAASWSSS